jgi:hypothetical protein
LTGAQTRIVILDAGFRLLSKRLQHEQISLWPFWISHVPGGFALELIVPIGKVGEQLVDLLPFLPHR